jgi:Flp pilus assembly protein TadG
MRTRANRNRRNQRGNSAVEFALGFSLLWACFSGVFQYGYTMYLYNGLQNAATDGAAYASHLNYCGDRVATFTTNVQQMVVYGDPTVATGASTVPGLTISNVTVAITPASFPSSVTVSIHDFTANALFSSFKFTNKPAVTMMYLANYRPPGSGC